MAINNKHYLLFLALILVVMAKTNSARTFSNRLLRLRDDNRGIGNGKLLFFSGFNRHFPSLILIQDLLEYTHTLCYSFKSIQELTEIFDEIQATFGK